TPVDIQQEALKKGVLQTVDQVLDYAQVLWNEYVLEMSPERQREVGISAVPEDGSELLARMPMVAQSYDAIRDAMQHTREAAAKVRQERPWSWRLALLGAGAAVVALWYGGRYSVGWIRRRWWGRRRDAKSDPAARRAARQV